MGIYKHTGTYTMHKKRKKTLNKKQSKNVNRILPCNQVYSLYGCKKDRKLNEDQTKLRNVQIGVLKKS